MHDDSNCGLIKKLIVNIIILVYILLGKGSFDMNRKQMAFAVRYLEEDKSERDENVLSFIASTDRADRYGDVIEQSGWELDSYKANPVVLFGHDHNSLPIGKGAVRQTPEGLVIDVTFDMEDPRAAEIAGKAERGFLNAVSVGFTPLKAISRANLTKDHYAYSDEGGSYFEKSELLEVSIVTIPANADATAIAAKNLETNIQSFIKSTIKDSLEEMNLVQVRQMNDDGMYEVSAPEGFHWMNYEDGPVLMEGSDADHEGASDVFAFEIVEEHDPSRMKYQYDEDSEDKEMDSEEEDKEMEDSEDEELERSALLKALLTLGD